MARRDKSPPTSKSALQRQDDAEAARERDLPLLSIGGLRARWKKVAAVVVLTILLFSFVGIVLVTSTAPANFEVTAADNLGLAKAGEVLNFTVTVRNTAILSGFAYETHVVGLPSGWLATSGDDLFALGAGESRAVPVSIVTGGSAPPNHDYPVDLKVFVKSTDRRSTFANKTLPLTVKLLSSNIQLNLELRGTATEFGSAGPTPSLNFTSCGQEISTLSFAMPFDANATAAGTSAEAVAATNVTGWLAVDVGADGTPDGNVTFSAGGTARLNFNGSAATSYVASHPAASGNVSVPLRFTSCSNGTAWDFALSSFAVSYHTPASAGTVLPVTVASPNLPQGEMRVFVNIRNNEPRPLTFLLSIPALPKGWEATPPLSGAPIAVPALGANGFEFVLHPAKTTPAGLAYVNISGCLQSNANDCATLNVTLDMPLAPFFTVKTYVEPAQLKEVFKGREADILLIAQNLVNQPISFAPDVLGRPDLEFSWWNGTGDLGPVPQFSLDTGSFQVFVLTVRVLGSATSTFVSLNPNFRNPPLGLSQTLQLSISIQDPPPDAAPAKLGDRATLEFTGVTADGFLFDTNQAGMLPIIDAKQRPLHAEFVKPTGTGLHPLEVTLGPLSNFTQTVHKGFEPYLTGLLERESVVLWLTPAQTSLPGNAVLRDTPLIFELRVLALTRI